MTLSNSERASRALARIGAHGGPSGAAAVGRRGGGSRSQVLLALRERSEAITIDHISNVTGLHNNTVRGHLDVLVAGGYAERHHEEPQGRGRPRLTYRAVPDAESPYDELARALTLALESADAHTLARATAEKWRRTANPLASAHTPDEAVDRAVEGLRAVGFDAVVSRVGDSIILGACPYASLIHEHPIICDIHTEMLVQMLDETGQEVSVAAMEVWVRPGVCRARLIRDDINPERTSYPGAVLPATGSRTKSTSTPKDAS